jgi:hypothetical protein
MSALPPLAVIAPVIRAVPVTIIVILSAPAWLTWPFLPEARQQIVLQMIEALARWTRGDGAAIQRPDSGAKPVVEGASDTATEISHRHD